MLEDVKRPAFWVSWPQVMAWFLLVVDVVTMTLEMSVLEFGSTQNIRTNLDLLTATVFWLLMPTVSGSRWTLFCVRSSKIFGFPILFQIATSEAVDILSLSNHFKKFQVYFIILAIRHFQVDRLEVLPRVSHHSSDKGCLPAYLSPRNPNHVKPTPRDSLT